MHAISIALIVVMSAVSSTTARARQPRIHRVAGQWQVTLPSEVRTAIRRFDATFRPWSDDDYLPEIRQSYAYRANQAPFAVCGDLNGDRRIDVVLDGRTASRCMILAVVSSRRGYRVLLVHEGEIMDPKANWYGGDSERQYGKDTYLNHVGPGTIKSPYEKRRLVLRTDGFEINYFERAASLYYYRDGKLHEYVTSD